MWKIRVGKIGSRDNYFGAREWQPADTDFSNSLENYSLVVPAIATDATEKPLDDFVHLRYFGIFDLDPNFDAHPTLFTDEPREYANAKERLDHIKERIREV